MGDYNALHEAQRNTVSQTEAKEASKFLQNNSAAGDDKLVQAVQEIYSRHNKTDDSNPFSFDGVKTASDAMYKLKNMDKNGKLWFEDTNHDGVIELPEIFIKTGDGQYRHVPEPKAAAPREPRSIFERGYDNVRRRNDAVNGKFDE